MNVASIRGEGVAAFACAHLLRRAGVHVVTETADRSAFPVIMVGEATQALFRDVFEQAGLFDGLRRIGRRIVAWGPDAARAELPHSAVVVSEGVLLDRLRTHAAFTESKHDTKPQWAIIASRPLPESSVEHHFGSRIAAAQAVNLKDDCDPSACWIESLETGWLFLIPDAGATGWLLSVGDTPESQLARSRLVAEQIQGTSGAAAAFPAYPRFAWPLCGPGWLACGTAALAVDPLCGDGTGYAIREAILASAVVRAAGNGANVDAIVAHYRTRLLMAFQRHLEACHRFYETGGSGPWWKGELDLLRRGLEWCRLERSRDVKFQYQLRGFELQPLD